MLPEAFLKLKFCALVFGLPVEALAPSLLARVLDHCTDLSLAEPVPAWHKVQGLAKPGVAKKTIALQASERIHRRLHIVEADLLFLFWRSLQVFVMQMSAVNPSHGPLIVPGGSHIHSLG